MRKLYRTILTSYLSSFALKSNVFTVISITRIDPFAEITLRFTIRMYLADKDKSRECKNICVYVQFTCNKFYVKSMSYLWKLLRKCRWYASNAIHKLFCGGNTVAELVAISFVISPGKILYPSTVTVWYV